MWIREILCVLGILACIFAFAFLIILGVRTVDRHYTGKNCPDKGISYGLPSRFVEYNFWQYECLVQISDKWIPVNQYRGVTNAP